MALSTAIVILDRDSRVIDYVAPLDVDTSVLKKAVDIGYHLFHAADFLSKKMEWGEIKSIAVKMQDFEVTVFAKNNNLILVINVSS